MRESVAPVCLLVGFVLLLTAPPHLVAQESSSSVNSRPSKRTNGTNVEAYLQKSLDTAVLSESGETEETQLSGQLQSGGNGTNLFWFFLKIGFGLGVIIGGIWLVSKILQKSGMTGTDSDLMGVRSTLPVGQNQYLQIVQVGTQYFMLGVTENQVTMLDELTDEDTIRSIRNEDRTSDEKGSRGFGDVFKDAIGLDNHEFNERDSKDHLDELQQKISKIGDDRERNR